MVESEILGRAPIDKLCGSVLASYEKPDIQDNGLPYGDAGKSRIVNDCQYWRPVRESNPCRRRERAVS